MGVNKNKGEWLQMKYYEFGNELDYYALIRAESPYVAAAKYIESVGYDAYDFGLVLEDTCEIAENSAFDKVVSAVVRNAIRGYY